MKTLYCDVCKKAVENPLPNRSYFHIADIDICESCRDDLELAKKTTLRTKKPFVMGWYDEFVLKLLHEGMQRGKINVPKK